MEINFLGFDAVATLAIYYQSIYKGTVVVFFPVPQELAKQSRVLPNVFAASPFCLTFNLRVLRRF